MGRSARESDAGTRSAGTGNTSKGFAFRGWSFSSWLSGAAADTADRFATSDNLTVRRAVISFAAAALSAVAVWSQNDRLTAAQEAPTFKSNVALVKVDAEVTDGSKLLDGFQKDDFRILDDGTDQPILYFSQGQEPLDLILLFDLSGSMIPKLRKLSESAHVALAQLRKGDRVAVMAFGSKSRVILPFTEDLDAVEQAIDSVTRMRMGGTRILAAINNASAVFLNEKRTQRRRAVVMVTDNHGQISGRKNTAVQNLWEADAVLSGLQVRFPGETALLVAGRVSPAGELFNSESMSGVAEKTGGEVLRGDAGVQFAELMHRLRLRYTLYYAMPKAAPGEERSIRVTLIGEARNRNPHARVRARAGYRVPKTQ